MLELNKIYQGDCTELMKSLPTESVDLIIADPPYYTTQWKTKQNWGDQVAELAGIKNIASFKADWDIFASEKDYQEFIGKWITEARRILKPKGTIFIHCILTGEWLGITNIVSALRKNEFKLLNLISWCKPNGQPNLAGVRFSFSTEQIIWAGKEGEGKRIFNYQRLKELNNDVQMRDFWIMPTEPSQYDHPSPKPIKLARLMIEACSNKDSLVCDPFVGSGTTAVAAKQLGRNFIGFEINPDYIKIAEQRLAQDTLLGFENGV